MEQDKCPLVEKNLLCKKRGHRTLSTRKGLVIAVMMRVMTQCVQFQSVVMNSI